MKKTLFGFALTLFGMQLSSLACSAQQAALPKPATKIIYAIRGEAGEAQQNAAIYQWQRVNREVDRLVADAHKLTAALPASAMTGVTPAATLDALQKAVQDGRAARLRHDVTGVTDATRRIIAACNTLLNL